MPLATVASYCMLRVAHAQLCDALLIAPLIVKLVCGYVPAAVMTVGKWTKKVCAVVIKNK